MTHHRPSIHESRHSLVSYIHFYSIEPYSVQCTVHMRGDFGLSLRAYFERMQLFWNTESAGANACTCTFSVEFDGLTCSRMSSYAHFLQPLLLGIVSNSQKLKTFRFQDVQLKLSSPSLIKDRILYYFLRVLKAFANVF